MKGFVNIAGCLFMFIATFQEDRERRSEEVETEGMKDSTVNEKEGEEVG